MPQVRSRCAASLVFSVLLTLPQGLLGQSQAPDKPAEHPAAPTYDGDWWLSLGGWEQYGVISGYEDCYAFEYRGSVPFTKEIQAYIDELNKYYLADPASHRQTVSEALDALRKARADQPPVSGGVSPSTSGTEAHGGFDGTFWFDADSAAELGFVEGYLACHSEKLKDADAKFSKAPSEYVDLINQAYNITDDTDEVDADKAPIKIADVLHKLKDAEPPPPKPAS